MEALRQVGTWPCAHAAAAVVYPDGSAAAQGEVDVALRWASVTKLATAIVALVGVEEGIVSLDEPAGPQGSTLRHLLAHASGLPFEGAAAIAVPGARRIYSNSGYEAAADHVARATGMAFPAYFEAVWGFGLAGSPAHGVVRPLATLVELARELMHPARISAEVLAQAVTVQFPGLSGVLPGIGRLDPNDWGLGPELRDGKRPHWTGTRNSVATFGHFGGAGGFLWVDPGPGIALAVLTDRDFGGWALEAWPRLSDAVLSELGS